MSEEEWQKTLHPTEEGAVPTGSPPDIYAELSIKAVYAENGKDLTVSFDWQNKRKKNGAWSKTSQLNDNLLYLDKLVSDAITEMITKLGIKVTTAKDKSSTKSRNPEDDKFEQYATLEFKPQGTREQTEQKQDLPPAKTLAPEENNTVHDKPGRGQKKVFELSLGASPFVPAGEATKITQLGLFPHCTISILFTFTPGAQLGLGLYAALNYFETTETVLAIPVMYIPLGLDLRFIIHSQLPFAFYMRASGGPAINLVFFDDGQISRLTTYVLGGIGLNLALGSYLGLGIDSSFILFFEADNPVMGFHPAAGLYLRL